MNPAAPVLQSRERPASRVHGRDALGWLIPLSLALHLALVASLLTLSSAPRLPDEAEALSVEFIAGAEPPGAAPQPLVPAETSPAPIASPIPVQQADATPPSPAPPPLPTPSSAQAPDIAVPLPTPPAVPGPEAPLPPPAATPAATAAPPDVPVPPPVPVAAPPSPTQQAELPLPAERPLPTPPLPPPAPPLPQVAQALPPPPRPQASRPALPRPAPPRPAPSPGAGTALASAAQIAASQVAASQAAAQAAASQAAASRASAAANGSAWLGRLKQWWDGHSFYPREASQADEGGAVRVRIAIAPDGQVTFIQVVGSSGSPVLDAAALAVFRGARLPPLSEAVAGPAEVVVTLHYRPAGNGG